MKRSLIDFNLIQDVFYKLIKAYSQGQWRGFREKKWDGCRNSTSQ